MKRSIIILSTFLFISLIYFNIGHHNHKVKVSDTIIIDNLTAFGYDTAKKSCEWRGFLGIRSCSASYDGCNSVKCSRKGCYTQ